MRQRFLGLRLHEVAVLVAGVLVAVYAAHVIRDAGTPPTSGSSSQVAVSPPSAKHKRTEPPSLAGFRMAASKSRTLLVIGDSTGAGPDAWVDLVARDLGKTRKVRLHQWDEAAGTFSSTPTVYGSGKPLAVWNLSYRGVEADYPRHLAQVPVKPGGVILDIGHDRDRTSLDRAVRVTRSAVHKRWGSVAAAWVLQNPSTGTAARQQRAAVGQLRHLATKADIPVIDVYARFRRSGHLPSLVGDDSRPTVAGTRLWANVVDRALGVKTG